MLPLTNYSNIAGIPLSEIMTGEQIERVIVHTKNSGTEIVNLLKTGSAYYAPSAAVLEIVDSILKDKKKILPCAVYLEGEFGINDTFIGVPAKIGRGGVEQVFEIILSMDEITLLQKSANSIKQIVNTLGRVG